MCAIHGLLTTGAAARSASDSEPAAAADDSVCHAAVDPGSSRPPNPVPVDTAPAVPALPAAVPRMSALGVAGTRLKALGLFEAAAADARAAAAAFAAVSSSAFGLASISAQTAVSLSHHFHWNVLNLVVPPPGLGT